MVRGLRWFGAAILLVVAYVHLALFLNMMSLRLLPMLFLINGVGALVAMIGVLRNARWVGWVLGIVMSGGAAVAKLAMNTIPGVGGLLMGMPRGGMRGARPPMGNPPAGGAPMGSAPMGGHGPRPGGMHGVLPLFMGMNTAATVSIVIELAFVALAIYALVVQRRELAAGEP